MPRKRCKNWGSTELPTVHCLGTSCARPLYVFSLFCLILFCNRTFGPFLFKTLAEESIQKLFGNLNTVYLVFLFKCLFVTTKKTPNIVCETFISLYEYSVLSPLYCFIQVPTSSCFHSSFLQTDLWGVPGVHSKNWHRIYDLSIMQCTWLWRKLQEYFFSTNSFLELSWLERSGQGERLRADFWWCVFVLFSSKQSRTSKG